MYSSGTFASGKDRSDAVLDEVPPSSVSSSRKQSVVGKSSSSSNAVSMRVSSSVRMFQAPTPEEAQVG
jgi:hypothetical protein